ncbi:MAG: four helix bundle protein [Candidatus Acidiferrales bacterium]
MPYSCSPLLRAGTSIGANVEEARAGQSRPDFINKNAIALEETREAHYWLRLFVASEEVPVDMVSALRDEAGELMRILGVVVSARKGLR